MDPFHIYFKELIITLCLIMYSGISIHAQKPDTTVRSQKESKVKNPLKATLFSAVLPGAGQAYVGGWNIVKIPVMYGGFGALVYSIQFNRDEYRRFDKAYTHEVRGEDHEFSDLNISAQGLRSQRDYYRKNLELSYIGMSLLYIANVADAFVSAHLTSFDVSDDLSLRLQPYGESTATNETIAGISLRFCLN